MRSFIYIVLLVFGSNVLHAQDLLHKTDSSILMTKILEVSDTQVKYKLHSNPDGPTHVISKEFVIRIVYATGIIEEFPVQAETQTLPTRKTDPRKIDFGRNLISVNILDLTDDLLSFGYEYTFIQGYSSFKIPISFRTFKKADGFEDKIFSAGLHYHLYPFGQGTLKFFYGAAFDYTKYTSASKYPSHEASSATTLLAKGGLLFQPLKHVNLSVDLGVGYSWVKTYKSLYKYGEIATNKSLNLGYKF